MDSVPVRSRQHGVTLVELMVVVVILAVIAAIAIPSYRQQVLRSNRSDAKVTVMQAAQNLERCFTRVSTYTGCYDDDPETIPSPEGLYEVTVDVDDLGTGYDISAVPQEGQANDTTCANFTFNEQSIRGVSGSGTVQECWAR
jgi:type IV pilus assembly protein PilE